MDKIVVTKECLNWCQEQYANHIHNTLLKDQTFIALALIMLVLYSLISAYWNWITSYSQIDENKLSNLHEALHFGAVVMLVLHIIYVVWK